MIKQKNAMKKCVGMVKDIAKQTNAVRVRLEELSGEAFFELSCEGRANSEEFRLFDGGNNRLNEAVHVLYEALCFYGGLLWDAGLATWDDESATFGKTFPSVEGSSERNALRGKTKRGEEKARCRSCNYCKYPRRVAKVNLEQRAGG